jgi:hypothetical protein
MGPSGRTRSGPRCTHAWDHLPHGSLFPFQERQNLVWSLHARGVPSRPASSISTHPYAVLVFGARGRRLSPPAAPCGSIMHASRERERGRRDRYLLARRQARPAGTHHMGQAPRPFLVPHIQEIEPSAFPTLSRNLARASQSLQTRSSII